MNNQAHTYDWQGLRIFLHVVRTGSLSRAGQTLGLSQPTVSRRMQALEKELGGPLLARTVAGCQPTARGASLLPLIEQMERASEGVQRLVESHHEGVAGEVRVATGELVGRLLARHSLSLLAGAPGIQLQVMAGMDDVNLERGDAHIALRNRRPTHGRLYAKNISQTRCAAYATSSFVDLYPEAMDGRRFESCRWVTFVPSLQHLPTASWLLQRLGEETPRVLFSTSGLILEAAATGTGIALLPTFIGDDDPRLRRVGGPFDDLSIEGWMVLHRDTRKLPHVRLIADRIALLLSQIAPLDGSSKNGRSELNS